MRLKRICQIVSARQNQPFPIYRVPRHFSLLLHLPRPRPTCRSRAGQVQGAAAVAKVDADVVQGLHQVGAVLGFFGSQVEAQLFDPDGLQVDQQDADFGVFVVWFVCEWKPGNK